MTSAAVDKEEDDPEPWKKFIPMVKKEVAGGKNNLPPWWTLQESAVSEILTAADTNYKQGKKKKKEVIYFTSRLAVTFQDPRLSEKDNKDHISKERFSCRVQSRITKLGQEEWAWDYEAINYWHTHFPDCTINILLQLF